MNIAVLGGGNSPERDVSLRSANAVVEAAQQAGYDVTMYDPADGLGFLDQLPKDTIVLPILHGAGGEDGTIQSELEARELKYLGSNSSVSTTCFDKAQTRRALEAAGLPIAAGDVVMADTYKDHPLTTRPHVLKVNHGGSSIGTLIVRDVNLNQEQQVQEIFALDNQAVIEELVEGIEVTVPILGNQALPVIEIQPPEGGEFDYENKYNGATKELCPPVSISSETQQSLQELALQAHQVLACRHLSRVDIIMRPNGDAVILEINTIPGLTNTSLYPKSALVAGMDMPQLVTKLIEMVEKGTT